MIEQKEDLRVKRTHFLLKEALLKLLMKKSFEEISVSDICETAMIHRTTFYKHFTDKFDLVAFILDEIITNIYMKSAVGKSFESDKDRNIAIVSETLNFIEANKKQVQMIFTRTNVEALQFFLSSAIERVVREIINTNPGGEHYMSNKVMEVFITGGLISLLLWYIRNQDKCSKTDILNYLSEVLV